jgi:plastocyanin
MSRLAWLSAGGGGLVIAAALACFSERSNSPTDSDLTCARAEQPPGPDTVFVIIRGFAFAPAQVSMAAGARVVWINCEPAGTPGHTSTVDNGAWDSPTLLPGNVFSVVPTVGSYDYHCRPHPFMQGRVVVQ